MNKCSFILNICRKWHLFILTWRGIILEKKENNATRFRSRLDKPPDGTWVILQMVDIQLEFRSLRQWATCRARIPKPIRKITNGKGRIGNTRKRVVLYKLSGCVWVLGGQSVGEVGLLCV